MEIVRGNRPIRSALWLNFGKSRYLCRNRACFLLADRVAGKPFGLLLLGAFGKRPVINQRRELFKSLLLLILPTALTLALCSFGCFRCEIPIVGENRNGNIPHRKALV